MLKEETGQRLHTHTAQLSEAQACASGAEDGGGAHPSFRAAHPLPYAVNTTITGYRIESRAPYLRSVSYNGIRHIPLQFLPFDARTYPLLQEHWKLPTVLEQV